MQSHYSNLRQFYNQHFKDLVTYDLFIGEKQIFKEPFAVFEINKLKYIIRTKHLLDLPFRIESEREVISGKDVYHHIDKYSSFKITPNKDLSFSELVDLLGGDITHSNKLDYLAYRLLIVISYIDILRLRFSTKPHFGKDSVTWQLYLLTNNIINFTPKTVAGVELFLDKPLVVMNELKGLNADQHRYVSQLLHKITDDSPVYTRGALSPKGLNLKQQYDLSQLSVVIFYNDKECSTKESDYFDNLFDDPIKDRIMPFKFPGELDMTQFSNPKFEESFMENYVKLAHSLEYYRLLPKNDMVIPTFDDKGTLKGRHIPIFNTIKKWVYVYCEEKKLSYEQILTVVLNAHNKYKSDLYYG